MKAPPRKVLLVGAIAVSLVAVIVLAGIGGTRWSSSPHRSRAHVSTGKAWYLSLSDWFKYGAYNPMENDISFQAHTTWNQARHNTTRSDYRQRFWQKLTKVADAPNPSPAPRTTARHTVLGTERDLAVRVNGLEISIGSVAADAANAVSWPEGERLRLRAVTGTWPTLAEEPLPVPAVYYDALDARPLSLDELPEAFREVTPDFACYYQLRLLFEVAGDLPFEDMEVQVFDARTHASVAALYHLGLGAGGICTREGRFLAVDLGAALWHDTPLELMVDLPAGPEQRHPFPAVGQPLTFRGADQRAIRLTRLASGEGHPSLLDDVGKSREVTFTWQLPDSVIAPSSPLPAGGTEPARELYASLWDLGDLLESEYVRIRTRGENEQWELLPMENCDRGVDPKGAELIFRPGRQRCWFKVAGLPMAPNPRHVRDLLDIRIPGPIDSVEYSWIAEAAQLAYAPRYSNPQDTFLEPPLTNASLRELLKIHAKNEDDVVTVDREKLKLVVEPKPPEPEWLRSLREWCEWK